MSQVPGSTTTRPPRDVLQKIFHTEIITNIFSPSPACYSEWGGGRECSSAWCIMTMWGSLSYLPGGSGRWSKEPRCCGWCRPGAVISASVRVLLSWDRDWLCAAAGTAWHSFPRLTWHTQPGLGRGKPTARERQQADMPGLLWPERRQQGTSDHQGQIGILSWSVTPSITHKLYE